MFSSLRTRFGIPGVISVIALVFAMLGGAYAASNSSSGGQATASKKKAKAKPGKPGKPGPQGAQGPQGPKGDKGDAGANGNNGATGATGATGGNGSSVEIDTLALGQCANGEAGVELSVSGDSAEVCDGLEGPQGPQGPTGQTGFTDVLPPGKTETGTFAVNWAPGTKIFNVSEISFPIPLATALDVSDTHTVTSDGKELAVVEGAPAYVDATNCLGSATNPIAPPGKLCVYVGAIQAAGSIGVEAKVPFIQQPNALSFGGSSGTTTSGATLMFAANGTGEGGAVGSWAVRAPTPSGS